jgi:hypothetical protein
MGATVDLQELLAVRDTGGGVGAPERALLLARLEAREVPDQALAAEPVGRTTARLLRLRQLLTGPVMEATVPCPACAAVVEFAVDTRDLLALEAGIVDAPAPLRIGGREIAWRPVSYADLGAVLDAADDDAAPALLGRCAAAEAGDLPEEARAALVAAMAEADPLLELDYDLTCPECGTGARASVDVAAFVWAEVEARARLLLAEVDALASAYGWSERDILDLPSQRRARYVDLVTGSGVR